MVYKYSIIFALSCFVSLFDVEHGCHYYYAGRRKRSTSQEAAATAEIRTYFTACMCSKVGGIPNWQSNIDYTILHSTWHQNTKESSCIGDSTAACWKKKLNNYVNASSIEVAAAGKQCIQEFELDKNKKFPSCPSQKRKKRQSDTITYDIPGSQQLPQYSSCLVGLNFNNRITRLNYESLAGFVFTHLQYSCSSRQSQGNLGFITWPFRLLVLTKTDSPLRESFQTCGKQYYPPDPFWSGYGPWSTCNPSCGSGFQTRLRTCRSGVDPKYQETPGKCKGFDYEIRICTSHDHDNCEITWNEWSNWSSCKNFFWSCSYAHSWPEHDLGQEIRTRTCPGANLEQGGPIPCRGRPVQIRYCCFPCALLKY